MISPDAQVNHNPSHTSPTPNQVTLVEDKYQPIESRGVIEAIAAIAGDDKEWFVKQVEHGGIDRGVMTYYTTPREFTPTFHGPGGGW